MKTNKITDKTEYVEAMKRIETTLKKATQNGGFENLSAKDVKTLKELSLKAEQFEDSIPLMPIKSPTSLIEMIRYKMFEMNLRQKQLAQILEVSETRISEVMQGKRKLNIELAKKLHEKLNIDAHFLLQVA
jgi:HTH-type transcriptional regulator/antitoxin HigA